MGGQGVGQEEMMAARSRWFHALSRPPSSRAAGARSCTSVYTPVSEPIVAGDGAMVVQVEPGKSYLWCSCGRSEKQPFCDGSHKGTDFKPVKFKAVHTEMSLCSCKHSRRAPKCDGSHNNHPMAKKPGGWSLW